MCPNREYFIDLDTFVVLYLYRVGIPAFIIKFVKLICVYGCFECVFFAVSDKMCTFAAQN